MAEPPSLLSRLPKGARLSPASAASRHRINTWLLWLQVPALALVGILGPRPRGEVFLVLVPVALALAAAAARARSEGPLFPLAYDLTSVGLLSCTFVLIELAGGAQETHFHIFVMLVFVSLYQSWRSLAAGVVLCAIHHTVLGVLYPEHVFGMEVRGWSLAGMVAVHVGMVLLEVIGILFVWHFAEAVEADNMRLYQEGEAIRTASIHNQELMEQERAAIAEAELQDRKGFQAVIAARTSVLAEATDLVRLETSRVADACAEMGQAIGELTRTAQITDQLTAAASERANNASGLMTSLTESSKQIMAASAIIHRIADQTNLLALNATIEAARAGDSGRGFAVVAKEVKDLARESGHNANTITVTLDQVQGHVAAAADRVAEITASIGEMSLHNSSLAAALEEQSLSLRLIVEGVHDAASRVGDIAAQVVALDVLAAGRES